MYQSGSDFLKIEFLFLENYSWNDFDIALDTYELHYFFLDWMRINARSQSAAAWGTIISCFQLMKNKFDMEPTYPIRAYFFDAAKKLCLHLRKEKQALEWIAIVVEEMDSWNKSNLFGYELREIKKFKGLSALTESRFAEGNFSDIL